MKAITLSQEQARRIFLHAQGLSFVRRAQGARAVAKVIEHLGYVQIDTLSVVERAHHHVLWSRFPQYKPEHQESLLRQAQIFEYWSHAAAFLPMSDFRFSLPRKRLFLQKLEKNATRAKARVAVFDRIRAEGALRSADFEHVKGRGSWWSWKPAKLALEELFHSGQLMVRERQGFQKVYDLTERVLPATVDTTVPTESEMARYLIHQTLRTKGFATVDEMSYLRQGDAKRTIQKEISTMKAEGQLCEVRVEGLDRLYVAESSIPKTLNKIEPLHGAHVLSPFDNAVIQRRRLLDLFSFDYRIECYVPQSKRIHGYFCLPLLVGERMVGRVDCKAHRESQRLHLQNLVIESSLSEQEVDQLSTALKNFSRFNACRSVVVEVSNRPTIAKKIQRLCNAEGD